MVMKNFNSEYLAKNTTQSVNGLFSIMVFCRHFKQYVVFDDNLANRVFLSLDGFFGQLIVVMFFFYSGYGIYRQIQNSSDGTYIWSFLRKRLLPVWISFAFCICLFIITDSITGRINDFSLMEIILAFTGWTSIGNSNWFMFDTFALYLLVFLSFSYSGSMSDQRRLLLFTAMTAVLAALLFFVKSSIWWNTIFCFPLGMWYAFFKENIDQSIKNSSRYWILSASLIVVFVPLWMLRYKFGGLPHIALSVVFAFIVLFITMKVDIANLGLGFLGKHLFSIYMLQRIVFTAYSRLFTDIYLYFACSLITTIVVATLYDRILNNLIIKIKRL